MLVKFPFSDNSLKELAFLDPRNRSVTSITGLVILASRFTYYSMDEIDTRLMIEFHDHHVAPLPEFIPSQDVTVYSFWPAMAEQKGITDSTSLRFKTLAQL